MKSVTLLLMLVSYLPSSIFAGDEVNNGGGLAEKNIQFAYLNMGFYINLCLNTANCKTTSAEQTLLNKIRNGLPAEYQNTRQLQLKSEIANPGTFIIDQELKLAVTGGKIGSAIYVNTDLIYTKDNRQQLIAMSIAEAVTMLIHEFGHHHDNADHNYLDRLGIKVSMAIHQNILQTQLLPHSGKIKSLVINGQEIQSHPQILIYLDQQIIDATAIFKRSIRCPIIPIISGIPHVPGATFSNKKARGSTFHNMYWLRIDKENGNTFKYKLKGNLAAYCKKNSKVDNYIKHFKAVVTFTAHKTVDTQGNESLQYNEGSLKVSQIYEPWWGLIKLPFFE